MIMNNYKSCCTLHSRIIFLFVACFFSINVYAHPFLWKVNNDEHEFYMFGTIHLPDPRVTSLPNEVNSALADASHFYAELDLSEENTMQIRQSMWLPEKKDLYDYLDDELEINITRYLESVNNELNLEFFSKQKIWVLAITLTVLEQQLEFPGHAPLDKDLYQKALSLGLNTGGLETIEEQLGVFESMTIDQQLTFLKDTVDFMHLAKANGQDFVEHSITAYLAGDLDDLMNHLMSYMKNNEFYDQLLERLINQRNLKMTERMLHLIQQRPGEKYFFAVGAGHFWGEKGIHSILKRQGYTVETIE